MGGVITVLIGVITPFITGRVPSWNSSIYIKLRILENKKIKSRLQGCLSWIFRLCLNSWGAFHSQASWCKLCSANCLVQRIYPPKLKTSEVQYMQYVLVDRTRICRECCCRGKAITITYLQPSLFMSSNLYTGYHLSQKCWKATWEDASYFFNGNLVLWL